MSKLNFKNFINEEDSDEDSMVFFFKKDGEIYGAPEESRLIFARMKHPDKETDKNWSKDASFVGVNLRSKDKQSVFGYTDLNKIKIIGRDEAIKQSKASKVPVNQNLDEK